MNEPLNPVPDDHMQRWKVAVYQIRTSALLLSRMIDPRPGSGLAAADDLCPGEKVSAWARSYLDAGRDHLTLWADFVAPYSFDTVSTRAPLTTSRIVPTF